jgi:hypothetical protein
MNTEEELEARRLAASIMGDDEDLFRRETRKRQLQRAADDERIRVIAGLIRGDGLVLFGKPVEVKLTFPQGTPLNMTVPELAEWYQQLYERMHSVREDEP